MTFEFDRIVVGSGPSGAMAAQTLLEAGVSVAMVDVGIEGKDYESVLPPGDFEHVRRTDPDQSGYLLGEALEAVPWGQVRVGAQLTPARRHLIAETSRLTPLVSDTFTPMESLAYGGLGAGWGLGSYAYSDAELRKAGLRVDVMRQSYQVVSDRIGISAGEDDIREQVVGALDNLQPALEMDNATRMIGRKYLRARKKLNRMGVTWGSPPMAYLSQARGDRCGATYEDMDFYTDRDRAAYRPWLTVDELRRSASFTYLPAYLAVEFSEKDGGVSLIIRDVKTGETRTLHARAILLAGGALSTARLVMRSLGISRLPLLCNPYAYMPCLNLQMMGIPLDRHKTSMGQAVMIYDPGKDHAELVVVGLYTYRSLLLYKMVKEIPFDFADGLKLMQVLQSALVVAGIHHPDAPSDQKYLQLRPDAVSFTGDSLFAHYQLGQEEEATVAARERAVRKALRKMGCMPIKRIDPGPGSSIHYAGTVPFSSDERPGTTHFDGRLHGCRSVFVADGSGFNFLPAKGVTLSLMANAHAVARGTVVGA